MCVTQLSRLLRLGIIAFAVTACVPTPYTVTADEGATLPSDVEFPELSGDLDDVVEAICSWASDLQRPFGRTVADNVYVETIVGPNGGRFLPSSLVSVFLQAEEDPQTLSLRIDPDEWWSRHGPVQLRSVVDHTGLWSFSKVSRTRCENGEPDLVRTSYDQLELCLEVRALDQPPEAITATADIRSIYYRIRGGSLRGHQLLRVRTLTLTSDGVLVGRTADAKFISSPNQFHSNHRCAPGLNPITFESPPY